ncbi:hypothetical protein DDE19_16355 [Micromonospora ureilytica]|uniref:Uncharacterized protein n=1 Tax=Micromonospora ureilytica TaxID=709868 RepID=A0A3N9XSV9_9ACTN|nr:hypothetical protein DDE19_16355 [Micromonospora ureilytica]
MFGLYANGNQLISPIPPAASRVTVLTISAARPAGSPSPSRQNCPTSHAWSGVPAGVVARR